MYSHAAKATTLVAIAFVLPIIVTAHGDGASLEKQVGNYLIDIGYEPQEPVAGERLLLDLDLLSAEGAPADFTSVWVRIQEGSDSILATGVSNPAIGPATLLMKLPDAGELTLYARFEREGAVLAEASFPLIVLPSDEEGGRSANSWLLPGLAGLLAGAVITLLLMKRA